MKKMFSILGCCLLLSCQGNSQQSKKEVITPTEGSDLTIQKSDTQWQAELSDHTRADSELYDYPGEYYETDEPGTYLCAGCGTPLFKSEHKFNSGTGWPSFDRTIGDNVEYSVDYDIGYKRTEEHCATCGGHLGHVFDDGPRETTGKRHCINGAALNFVPDN